MNKKNVKRYCKAIESEHTKEEIQNMLSDDDIALAIGSMFVEMLNTKDAGDLAYLCKKVLESYHDSNIIYINEGSDVDSIIADTNAEILRIRKKALITAIQMLL